MKTSVIEVHDMLSVLSVDGVEKRIGEVPGVESVTVNYAAGSATVRYDETRLEIADIKSAVRQSGYESDAAPAASAGGHEGHTPPGAAPSLATTLGVAYIFCAIFDVLFPPFGLLAALAPASPWPISGSPLAFLTGFVLFTVAGFVLGALYGIAWGFWSKRDCGEMTSWIRIPGIER